MGVASGRGAAGGFGSAGTVGVERAVAERGLST